MGNERLCPRTYGITQNEQRLSHPSCTLRFGRVRSLAASNTGAANSSVWAKISPTITLGLASCASETNPVDEAPEVAISAAWCLLELPTTQVTPGSAANSSGARCA